MKFRVYVLGAMALSALNCGKSSSTDRTAVITPTQLSGSGLSSDPEASMGLVANNMNEASSAAGNGDLQNDISTTLNLAAGSTSIITNTRTCTTNTDGTATVDISNSGSHTNTVASFTMTRTATGTEVRTWSNSGQTLTCGPLGRYVKINWGSTTQVNSLTLTDTTSLSNTQTTTFTSATSSRTRTVVNQETGTRTVVWTATGTDTTTVSKTINSTISHTHTLTKVDGTQVNLSATHATLQGSPLLVTKVSDATTHYPITFTIVSGTMSITKTGQFYVTNSYSNVKFDLSASDPCTPSSGTLTTNIYTTSTDSTPLKTYTTTFSSSGPTVTGDTTATTNFHTNINHNCVLSAGY